MIAVSEPLPDDMEALKALVLSARTELAAKDAELARAQDANARLWETLRQLRRAQFGRKSKKLDPDQLSLAMEETEQAIAERGPQRRPRTRRRKRRPRSPALSIAARCRPICRGRNHHRAGELGLPVLWRRHACHGRGPLRAARRDAGPVQSHRHAQAEVCLPGLRRRGRASSGASAVIEAGIPTENLVAHVLVSKYADHCPLYRQTQIYSRQGVDLDRSTLADWVGRAAGLLAPLQTRLFEYLKASPKLFADQNVRCPVLDPGRKRVKRGQLWA